MKSQSLKHTTENAQKKGKVQPKLKVSTPGDAYEREADAMAERVMKKTESHGVIARSLKEVSDSEKKGKGDVSVRRKVSDDGGVTMPPSMISTLSTPRQGGEPLSDDTRTVMEDAFSRDFSHVRVHKDHDAAGMSREIHAKAFTYGNDIYFNQGQFSPETPEGKNLLAHELTHVVQHQEDTSSPDIARAVELRPPGKGEASAFERVQELIDKLNVQSTAIQYRLDGQKLIYEIKDENALSIFDLQMRSYLDMDAVVPLRLITGEGRVPKGPNTLGRLTFDQLITGYVDMEDLLSTDRLAFQSIFIHILAERFSSPNYAKRIGGNTFTGQEFKATHAAGHHAQAFHFQGVFKDPSIKFVYEEPKPGNRAHIVFRSTEKKYEVFVIVSKTNEDISHAEVRVRDADHKWYTADEFLALNSTATSQPTVQPQLSTGQSQRVDEVKAVEKAKQLTEQPATESSGTVMRKVNSDSSFSPSLDWIRELDASGTGSPLPDRTRRFMEDSFRADFSNVRIHNDPLAANLSEDIHAKAFTYNGTIYFNRGEFSPDSSDGKRLLAHELTHVMQQRGEGIRNGSTNAMSPPTPGMIQRGERKKASDKEEDEDAEPDPKFKSDVGEIDLGKKLLQINKLKYVKEKFNELPETLRTKRFLSKKERRSDQRVLWKKELKDYEKGLQSKVKKKGEDERAKVEEDGNTFYFFKQKKPNPKGRSVFIIGTLEDVVDQIITPIWNEKGDSHRYHVDHILEAQIGGAHDNTNFWLWEEKANMSGGSKLANLIKETIHAIVKAAVEDKKVWRVPKRKNAAKFIGERADEVRSKESDFKVGIQELVPGLKIEGDEKEHFDINQTFVEAKPLDGLKGMTEGEVNNLRGSKNKLSIMIGNVIVGTPLKIDNDFSGLQTTWIEGFTIMRVLDYKEDAKPGENYASLHGELFKELEEKKLIKQTILDIPVVRIGFAQEGKKGIKSKGLMYFGKIENGFREKILQTLEFPGSSPIEIIDAYFSEDGKAILQGKVKPSISLLKGLEFDLLYSGKTLTLSKTFTTQDLKGKLPKPFDITNAEITLSVNTATGFGAEGQIDFEIQNIGTGFIKGERKGALILSGGFEFEKGFFDKSGITVTYKKEPGEEEGKFSFSGFAEKSGDKTIKSARIEVSYENNILTAKGLAKTNLPGLSEGKIEVITGKGLTSVVADFDFGDSIPGVKAGNLHFVFKKNEEGKYLIEASSEIYTKFPGIPHVTLKGFYNSDGVFMFEGDAELHLGRFNGDVHFGITNQEVDEHGQLVPGKKGDKLVAFGKGNVDFKMTDWLNGKIGAEVTPDARVILSGKLIPDPHLAITKQKDPINKKFGTFNLPQFTLFGIPRLAEIFVSASGGFFLEAGIGPLYLNDAILEFKELDIEAPERTIVTGSGKLDLPGFARLGVQLTITAGVGIALVEVSINLTGSLAFEIAGNAGFQMSFTWSVGSGVKINEALATLKAQTALIAKLGGEFLIELDLFFTEIEIYRRPFNIGEKRWPLGLDLDLKFPLGFDGGDTGKFKLPHPDSVKHDDPKVDKGTIKKGVMEDPPSAEPAPGKEKALQRTRVLKADATASSWIQRLYERYSYVDGLKKKYPDVNWGYLDTELQVLDAKEFNHLRDLLLYRAEFPRTDFGRKLRQSALYNFEEEHRYVNPVEVADLRSKIQQLKEED